MDVDSSSKRDQTYDVALFQVQVMLECFFTIYSAPCAFQVHNFCLLVCEGSKSSSAAFPSNRFLAHPTRCQLQDTRPLTDDLTSQHKTLSLLNLLQFFSLLISMFCFIFITKIDISSTSNVSGTSCVINAALICENENEECR